MDWNRTMRLALLASVPLNLGVACLFLAPDSALGQLAGLPLPAPHPAYSLMLAMMVALFGAAYGWLALQAVMNRAVVVMGTVGKTLAFGLSFVLWCSGEVTDRWMLLICGDLIFAALFTGWLISTRAAAAVRAP